MMIGSAPVVVDWRQGLCLSFWIWIQKLATRGGRAAVPGAADLVPENAAPALPAPHQLGNACGHGCRSAIGRTILITNRTTRICCIEWSPAYWPATSQWSNWGKSYLNYMVVNSQVSDSRTCCLISPIDVNVPSPASSEHSFVAMPSSHRIATQPSS